MKEILSKFWSGNDRMKLHEAASVRSKLGANVKMRRPISTDCDVEIDLNGEHTFVVNKNPLVSYSAHILKTLHRARFNSRNDRADYRKCQKIVLHDFPGGPEAFELVVRFCYAGGKVQITSSNVSLLRTIAEVLHMSEEYAQGNLIRRTEEFLRTVEMWDWKDILIALRACEDQSVLAVAENAGIVQRYALAMAGKICSSMYSLSPAFSSPSSTSSSEYASSSSSSSSLSSYASPSTTNWWFSDIVSLSPYLMQRVVTAMMSYKKIDHRNIAKLLLFYLRCSLPPSLSLTYRKKIEDEGERKVNEAMEIVVSLLFLLPIGSLCCKQLFTLYRVALTLKPSQHCITQLEKMMAMQLHNATLDYILIPTSSSTSSSASAEKRRSLVYDVDLVLRLIWYWRREYCGDALQRVGRMVDMYLAEVAPDPHLQPQKFVEIAKALPSSARHCHDDLYRAVDIYIEGHEGIDNEEVCGVVDVRKLSHDACSHIANNPRIPANMGMEALVRNGEHALVMANKRKPRVVKFNMMGENEELRLGLRQMQNKVMELEKLYKCIRSEVVENVRPKGLMC